MTKLAFVLNETSRRNAMAALVNAPDGMEVIIQQRKRTLPQNDKLHAVLRDISEQVVWYGEKLSVDEWKIILSASWKKQSVKRGIDGGFVVMGTSTSAMTKAELSELVELAYAFGSEQGVRFSETVYLAVPSQR